MSNTIDNCLYKSKYAELHLEHLYTVEENITFSITVKSYEFYGKYNFCMHISKIYEYIERLNFMNQSFSGECKIMDSDSNSFICLMFEEQVLKVTGQLGGSYEDNFMKFSFLTDQTLIKLFIEALLKIDK